MESNFQSRHLNAWVISHIQYTKKTLQRTFFSMDHILIKLNKIFKEI